MVPYCLQLTRDFIHIFDLDNLHSNYPDNKECLCFRNRISRICFARFWNKFSFQLRGIYQTLFDIFFSKILFAFCWHNINFARKKWFRGFFYFLKICTYRYILKHFREKSNFFSFCLKKYVFRILHYFETLQFREKIFAFVDNVSEAKKAIAKSIIVWFVEMAITKWPTTNCIQIKYGSVQPTDNCNRQSRISDETPKIWRVWSIRNTIVDYGREKLKSTFGINNSQCHRCKSGIHRV